MTESLVNIQTTPERSGQDWFGAAIRQLATIGADTLFDTRFASRLWKPLVKRYVTGSWAPLVMRPAEVALPHRLDNLGLYLHVPFCHAPCPYCPYNRVKYDEAQYRRYESAVHQEIDLYGRRMTHEQPHIASLYVGGGTPTIEPESLAGLISHIHDVFGPAGDICVECHPSAMDDACLGTLKSIGVSMVSIGVESLSDRLLGLIGRSHDAATAEDAVRRAVACGFDSVNVDLMFALPTQTVEDLDYDLCRVLDLGVDQITAYPIFGFPYTKLGEKLGIKRICRPPGERIRRMLARIRCRSEERGFRQCAVWSYLRPDHRKFSSTTRHNYLGFGPSAASMTGTQFYVNTHSVEEYASTLPDRLPVALTLPVDRRLEIAFWLYWRIYEMRIPIADFRELFGRELEKVYGGLLGLWERMGMLHRLNGSYHVTDSGAYWIHRLQNEYALNSINRLWGKCRSEPWPQEVTL